MSRSRLIALGLISGVLALSVLASPFLIVYAPAQISDYAYRELSYGQIAHRLTQTASTDEEKALTLHGYISRNIAYYPGASVVDQNPFSDLLRGVGWCDQQAYILMTFLDKLGVDQTRLRDVTGHTFAEVLLDGEWRVIDPTYGALFFRRSDRELATQRDIVAGDTVSAHLTAVHALKDLLLKEPIGPDRYVVTEGRWPNGIGPRFTDYGGERGPVREVLRAVAEWGYALYGPGYAAWYQDRWLDKLGDLPDQNEIWFAKSDIASSSAVHRRWFSSRMSRNDAAYTLFHRARNYHLYGRDDQAVTLYRTLIEQHPNTVWASLASLHVGTIYVEQGDAGAAVPLLRSIDLDENPFAWQASYWLGVAHEQAGDLDKAIASYTRSLHTGWEAYPGAARLHRLLTSASRASD